MKKYDLQTKRLHLAALRAQVRQIKQSPLKHAEIQTVFF